MLEFIIILIAAIIVISLTFWLISRKKMQRSSLFSILSGLVIAIIAIFVGNNFSFYYTILVIFGLAFAISVLLDKRLSAKREVKEPINFKEIEEESLEEIELQRFLKEETPVAEDDLVIEETSDDDLEMFMSDIPIDTPSEREEHNRSEK